MAPVSASPASPKSVVLVVADTVDTRVLQTVRQTLESKGVDVQVESEAAAQKRRTVLVTDHDRLSVALTEHLKSLVVAEAPPTTWRDHLPDAPQFRQTGPRPPRRYRRR